MTMRYILGLVATATLLTSCGTVSSKVGAGATSPLTGGGTYHKVLVRGFTHTVTDDDGTTPVAARRFADKIAAAIPRTAPGAVVTRSGSAGKDTLVVDGVVTRYMEGNATLRLLVGMGAGSSYFDATVKLSDGATGAPLTTIKVDKNSWALGGIIAASQTVDTYMDAGANKTAAAAAPYIKR